LAGALTAGRCLGDPETERLAGRLYARVDFPWMLAGSPDLLSMGWTPEKGFIPARWDTYSEHMILDLLAIGSPTHPIPAAEWTAWTRPQVRSGGRVFVAGVPPLFIHQYSQAYVDFRRRRDRRGVDWWENSVQASEAQAAFFQDQVREYPYLTGGVWGLTASDGPRGYMSWGAPPADPAWDGTLVPCAPAGSLMLTPAASLKALREMKRRWGAKVWGRYGFVDAFDPRLGWFDKDVLGIDQGITLLSAEDLRGGLVWGWFMANPEMPRAMTAVGLRDESRVEDLLSQMTLEEKLGQLQQRGGPVEGDAELTAMARAGRLGSTLNVRGAKTLNALQRAAVEGSRLHIPLLFGFDVIHGYRTVFPIPLAMASSWDPAVPETAARLSAEEASKDGLRWTFSPMVDVARDPRWGRVAEGAGEDPFLGAAMARAYVEGYQGDDPSRPDRLAACAKHWVGYGAAEAGRDYNTTEVSEHTLRDVYFPPFKAAVDAGALTFMSAFNDLDGVP
ncbi:MAG: hypothetical protein KGL53_10010, partial [Elusimicrobia bacterium]|nr:hypothetical protein [Elusimicrobiota bacterium]